MTNYDSAPRVVDADDRKTTDTVTTTALTAALNKQWSELSNKETNNNIAD